MLLRFSTAGSVDDGKSTLIGRLLYDTKSLLDEHLQELQRASKQSGAEGIDLALLTDGLRDEREQKITIDVAYRFFSTPRRKFIIADTPGHQQYTRNMVTGSSTADLALLLVDAQSGITEQTRRHAFVASLLNIPNLLLVVNKMDLVDYCEQRFLKLCQEFEAFSSRLNVPGYQAIPISALLGDNVVQVSEKMSWYKGGSLLNLLESAPARTSDNLVDFRLPIQCAIRPHSGFRGFAGQIASGRLKVGDEILELPNGLSSSVTSILTPEGETSEAIAGQPVVVTLSDDIDVGRASMLVRPGNLPMRSTHLDLNLCWMSETPLKEGAGVVVLHTTNRVRGTVRKIDYTVDVNTLHRQPAEQMLLNEIGRVQIELNGPLFFDTYRANRATGSLALVDPSTLDTIAAGMIRGQSRQVSDLLVPDRVGSAAVIWLTGLSGSGKSTISEALEKVLLNDGIRVTRLDGDRVREGLCQDLGFSFEDRLENVRRVAEVARLFCEAGTLVLCSFISPTQSMRDRVRAIVEPYRFLEVHVDSRVETCRKRDVKGLYAKADRGEIADFTGVSSPYEAPEQPDLHLPTEHLSLEQCVGSLRVLIATI